MAPPMCTGSALFPNPRGVPRGTGPHGGSAAAPMGVQVGAPRPRSWGIPPACPTAQRAAGKPQRHPPRCLRPCQEAAVGKSPLWGAGSEREWWEHTTRTDRQTDRERARVRKRRELKRPRGDTSPDPFPSYGRARGVTQHFPSLHTAPCHEPSCPVSLGGSCNDRGGGSSDQVAAGEARGSVPSCRVTSSPCPRR